MNDVNQNKDISLKDIAKVVVGLHDNIVTSLRPFVSVALDAYKQFETIFSHFIKELEPVISGLIIHAKEWQKKHKISVAKMAEQGWFPNWGTFFYVPTKEYQNIDDLMIDQIDECWDDLKQKIYEFVPERKQILEVAFDLHEKANYFASIPILLAQADGICSEDFAPFFSKDYKTGLKGKEAIIEKTINDEIQVDFFTEILLEPFKADLNITKGSSKASKRKNKGPNRHGILHGSGKHLDYGTKANGYKAFSFLAFITFTVKDKFKKHNTSASS